MRHYRFLELDDDIRACRDLDVRFGLGNVDTLRKDGGCERRCIESCHEGLEHDIPICTSMR